MDHVEPLTTPFYFNPFVTPCQAWSLFIYSRLYHANLQAAESVSPAYRTLPPRGRTAPVSGGRPE